MEMARQANAIEDRPTAPDADAPVVLAVLRRSLDAVIVTADEAGQRLSAAWWHWHAPPLLCDDAGEPLPEMIVALVEQACGRGVGTGLKALAANAKRIEALAANVIYSTRLLACTRGLGSESRDKGRGRFGVAMRRSLESGGAEGRRGRYLVLSAKSTTWRRGRSMPVCSR